MASDSIFGTFTNNDAGAINNGEVVRVSGNDGCVLALADSSAHVQGLTGVSLSGIINPGGPVNTASAGVGIRVRLENGLTPVAGETLYVSATVAGRATNVAPALAVAIGTIDSVGTYLIDGRVTATVSIAGASSGGSFAGFSGPPAAIAKTVSNASGTALTALRSDSTRGQFLVADWDIATTRTFLYDPVNGVDTNPGFSDGVGPYNPALLARKTVAGMLKVFPSHFAGRMFRLLVASGAYAAADLDNLLAGITGYASNSLVRATGTLASAGATAFADDTADRIALGATTATSCNAAGYNPIGVPTTTVVQLQLNGGGAAGLLAEPASPLMWRMRFDAATATAALRNVCRTVVVVSGGDTVTLDSALPAVPAGADVAYLEMSGVSFPTIRLSGSPPAQNQTTSNIDMQIVGIRSLGVFQIFGGSWQLAFMGAAGGIANRFGARVSVSNTYRAAANSSTSTTVGGGLRGDGALSNASGMGEFIGTLTCVTGFFGFTTSPTNTLTNGCVISSGIQYSLPSVTTLVNIGSSSFLLAQQPVRIIGPGTVAGLDVNGGQLNLDRVAITGMGAKPAISLRRNSILVIGSACTGSTGNTDVGLDLSGASSGEVAKGALIVLYGVASTSKVPTVTGTAGDIRDAGGNILTWAQVAATGYVDCAGNRFVSVDTSPLAVVGKFSGVIVADNIAATSTDLGDPGSQNPITTNATDKTEYPTSLRLISRLRVCAISGNGSTPYTVTLYKRTGGVRAATTMTVTVPALSAAFTVVSDTAHPIVFQDGDTFALQVDMAANEGTDQILTATLEGPV